MISKVCLKSLVLCERIVLRRVCDDSSDVYVRVESGSGYGYLYDNKGVILVFANEDDAMKFCSKYSSADVTVSI